MIFVAAYYGEDKGISCEEEFNKHVPWVNIFRSSTYMDSIVSINNASSLGLSTKYAMDVIRVCVGGC